MNMNQYLELAHEFLEKLFNEIEKKHLYLIYKEIDHVCFRTDSTDDYSKVCKDFSAFGELLIEAPVKGRLISTFKLYEMIIFRDLKIPLVEIPAPKIGKTITRGFEHIELVVEEPFEVLIQKYEKFKLEKNGLTKKINPELELVLDSGSIKFHHQSLEDVIKFEKKELGLL